MMWCRSGSCLRQHFEICIIEHSARSICHLLSSSVTSTLSSLSTSLHFTLQLRCRLCVASLWGARGGCCISLIGRAVSGARWDKMRKHRFSFLLLSFDPVFSQAERRDSSGVLRLHSACHTSLTNATVQSAFTTGGGPSSPPRVLTC